MNKVFIPINTHSFDRPNQFETDVILCSLMNLLIGNHSHDSGAREYLPEIGFLPSGEVVFANGQIKMRPNQPFAINHPNITSTPFDIQPSCEPTVFQCTGSTSRIINGHHNLRGKFFYLRIFDIQNRINLMLQPLYPVGQSITSWDMRDVQIATELGARFGQKGQWNSKAAEFSGHWKNSPVPTHALLEFDLNVIHIKNASGAYVYSLQIFYLDNGAYAILPIAYYQHPAFTTPLKLFIPPAPPYTWINSEHLQLFPKAKAILTNDVLLAINNPPSDQYIFLGNPGADAWIENIDIESLVGHEVICLVDGATCAAQQSAINIAVRLNTYGITPSFALKEVEDQASGRLSYPEVTIAEVVSMRNFLKTTSANIPETIQLTRNGAIDIEEIQTSTPLLENVVELGVITTILEHNNVELNILSSRMLVALQSNLNLFSNHSRNLSQKSIKSIVFIDIERKRHFVNLIRKTDAKFFEDDIDLLFDTRFLNKTLEDGVEMFNNIIKSTSAKTVIFDTESVWNGGTRRILIFKEILRRCISKNIAVVVVMRNKKYFYNLPQPDRLLQIWKYGDSKHHHVVETESCFNKNIIEPFQFYLQDGQWISEAISRDILPNIPGWQPNAEEPGIHSSFDDAIDNSSKEELLGLSELNNAGKNSGNNVQSEYISPDTKHIISENGNQLLPL